MGLLSDAPLRRARRLQLARRICLAFSWAFLVVAPFAGSTSALGAPWSVSILGVELLDPLAALGLTVAGRATVAVIVGALPLLVLIAALGRYFCGWLCPYVPLVATSDAIRVLLEKRGVRLPDLKLPPRLGTAILAALVIATAIGGTQLAALVYPPSILGRAAWKLVATGAAGAGALVVVAAFLFDTFVSRAGFCRAVCPGGTVFRLLSAASPVRVVRDSSTCTSCTICDEVCRMAQSPMTDRVAGGCDRCARCVSACPTGSLELVAIARRGHRSTKGGTP